MRQATRLALVLWAGSWTGCRAAPNERSGLVSDPDPFMEAHAPVVLIAMLDSSESMTNRQMELARSFLAQLVRTLHAADRFSLVLIADEANVVIESGHATPEAKQAWLQLVQSIEAEGLTNLEDALELAATLDTLEARVLLITDGSPTWGTVAPDELVRSGEDLDLWTIGVGRHDEALLRELGRYFYLSDPTELAGVITRELFQDPAPGLVTLDEKAVRSPAPARRDR